MLSSIAKLTKEKAPQLSLEGCSISLSLSQPTELLLGLEEITGDSTSITHLFLLTLNGVTVLFKALQEV